MAPLPFDPSRLSPSDLAIYRRMLERRKSQGAGFGGPYAALMNHPQLCEKIEELGYYLKFQAHLPRNIYQFLVLSVARYTNVAFEWIDHVEHAKAAGVPQSVIDTLQKVGVTDGVFPEPYALIADVLKSALAWKNVPQDLQDRCISLYGVEGFVELVVLAGFYQMFSAINQGFDVSLPKGVTKPF
jgi:4-carboxymuconolactone decarboxylase